MLSPSIEGVLPPRMLAGRSSTSPAFLQEGAVRLWRGCVEGVKHLKLLGYEFAEGMLS